MTRMRGAFVGAFVVGGLLLFGCGLFLIGDRRLLFSPQFELNSTFGRVTGLQIGTRVRVAGLDAGEVLEIVLPSRPSDRFRVRMRLREDVRQLVRTDSIAAVQTDGIVGNAFIQIAVGTDQAPAVTPGGTIAGADPIDFADLIQEGRDTFRMVSREVIELKADVSTAITALTETVQTTSGVVASVGENASRLADASATVVEGVEAAVADGQSLVNDVRLLVNRVGDGEGTIGQLLTDRTLYNHLTGMGREAEEALRHFRETSARAQAAVEGFTSPTGTGRDIAWGARKGRERASKVIDRSRQAAVRQKQRVDELVQAAGHHAGDIQASVAGAVTDAKSAFARGREEALRE